MLIDGPMRSLIEHWRAVWQGGGGRGGEELPPTGSVCTLSVAVELFCLDPCQSWLGGRGREGGRGSQVAPVNLKTNGILKLLYGLLM